MKLQFLVNHYNEPPEIVGRLLNSIAMQNGIMPNGDYNVLVCNDGADNVLQTDFLDRFPFRIGYQVTPHRGVCATRNTLLDTATADYVMFCDADDCFCDADGVTALLQAAQDADVVSAPFYQEVKTEGGFDLKRKSNNATWIHSKLFRREYLSENDIRFPGEIETAGDMSFVWQTFHMTDKIHYLEKPVYVWKWNAQSVTRSLPLPGVRTYANMVNSFSLLADKMLSRQRNDLRDEIVAVGVSMAYLDFKLDIWGKAPLEYREPAKQAAKEFVAKFRAAYDTLDEKRRFRAYNHALVTKRTYGPHEGFNGIQGWLDEVTQGE